MLRNSFYSKVAKSFDYAAYKYGKHSDMQYQIAQKLCNMIISNKHELILDIGCGIGYIGQLLGNRVIQLDVAFNMCKHAQENSKGHTINADMHYLPLKNNCIDIATASMSLHWSPHLERTIVEIYRVLSRHGKLYFTVPVNNTFYEFNHILSLLDIPVIKFIQSLDIISLLEKHKLFTHHETNISSLVTEYDSCEDFIRFMKNTGANISKNKSFLTKEVLKKINKLYGKMFASGDKIKVSWDIAYIVATK